MDHARKATARLLSRNGLSVQLGAWLFIAGAVLSVGTMLAPHSAEADEVGFYWLALAELAVGAVALALPPRAARRYTPPLFPVAGVLAVTASLYFNGERVGGDATLTELYYVWPLVYAGYFCSPRLIVGTLGLLAIAHAGAMAVIAPTADVGFTRWVVTISVVMGATAAFYALRRHVERLVGALHAAARTDPLTGMLNRRGFHERFELEIERSSRSGEPFALLLGDLDEFKRLNDRFGHIAGDEALAAVGATLREASRAIDTAARIGGEEFVLLMPGTRSADGLEAAERLRVSVVDLCGPDGRPLTISFGVVEHPAHGQGWSELMRSADDALYAAKSGGRNRSVAYGGELQPA